MDFKCGVCRSKDLRYGSYGGYFLHLVYIWLNGSTTENTEEKRSTRSGASWFSVTSVVCSVAFVVSAFVPKTAASYLVSDAADEARANDSAYLM